MGSSVGFACKELQSAIPVSSTQCHLYGRFSDPKSETELRRVSIDGAAILGAPVLKLPQRFKYLRAKAALADLLGPVQGQRSPKRIYAEGHPCRIGTDNNWAEGALYLRLPNEDRSG